MQKSDKKFVYHRALNTPEAFEDFLQKEVKSEVTLVAEGDICWSFIDGAFITYIHHPALHGKSLSDAEIKELLAKGELFTLEKLFAMSSDVHFILELKTGRGNLEQFFQHFGALLERYGVQNLLVDAFSVEQLRELKRVLPQIKTSLHTKFIFKNYLLESTFEKPYFRLHNIYDLAFIDTLTISYASTHVNILNLDIDKAYKEVYKAQKSLNLGAIKSLSNLSKAVQSQSDYIYLRSKEVLNGYTNLLKTH